MTDFAAMRRNMVENQIRTNRVTDPRVIEAMETVPRELFVPKAMRAIAYIDEDIQVAPGRYLLEPMVMARLLQAAEIGADDVVLDIGCATGYGPALLARLAASVVGLESDAALADKASALLAELGVDNAAVVTGPLEEGYPKQAPYDVILIEGAVDEVPRAIADQLAEGGRLATVVRTSAPMGRATVFLRLHGAISRRPVFDAAVPLLPGFRKEPEFVF